MKKIFDLLFVSLFVIVGFVSCDSKKEDTSIAEDNSGYSISTEIQDSIVLLPNSKKNLMDKILVLQKLKVINYRQNKMSIFVML